jgi:hypothetical protein
MRVCRRFLEQPAALLPWTALQPVLLPAWSARALALLSWHPRIPLWPHTRQQTRLPRLALRTGGCLQLSTPRSAEAVVQQQSVNSTANNMCHCMLQGAPRPPKLPPWQQALLMLRHAFAATSAADCEASIDTHKRASQAASCGACASCAYRRPKSSPA